MSLVFLVETFFCCHLSSNCASTTKPKDIHSILCEDGDPPFIFGNGIPFRFDFQFKDFAQKNWNEFCFFPLIFSFVWWKNFSSEKNPNHKHTQTNITENNGIHLFNVCDAFINARHTHRVSEINKQSKESINRKWRIFSFQQRHSHSGIFLILFYLGQNSRIFFFHGACSSSSTMTL